jgi:hypothetical protein
VNGVNLLSRCPGSSLSPGRHCYWHLSGVGRLILGWCLVIAWLFVYGVLAIVVIAVLVGDICLSLALRVTRGEKGIIEPRHKTQQSSMKLTVDVYNTQQQ